MEDKKRFDRCAKCKSTMNYIRLKTMERVCRKCGHKESIEEEEEQLQTYSD